MGMADVVEYLLTRRASRQLLEAAWEIVSSWAELQRSWELSPKGQCLERTWYIKEEEMTLKWSTSTCAYFNFYSSLIQCGLVASELAAEPNGFHDAKAFLTSHLTELKPRRGYEIHHHRFPLPSMYTKKMTIKVTF